MSQEKSLPVEITKVREERDLYAQLLKEANLRFEEKVNELSLLRRVGDIITYAFDLQSFCQNLTNIILEETNAENCSLLIKELTSNRLILKVASGAWNQQTTFFENITDSTVIFSMGEGIAGKVAFAGKPILVNDVKNDERFDHRRKTNFPIGSLLCCPLVWQEQVLGVVNLSNPQPYAFNNDDVRTISLLSTFATSIFKNAIAYAELKESEEKFRTLFEGAQDALLIIDPSSHKIIDCNKQTEEWLGFTKRELFSLNHIQDIFASYPENRELFNEIINNINHESIHEITFLSKDGTVRSGEIKVSPINYLHRELFQLAIRDITERKEIEEKLIQTEKFKALGELAGGVAHDFNNILTAILGRVQLLMKSLGSLPTGEWTNSMVNLKQGLEVIESAGLDGSKILQRLQEFYRVRSDDKNFSLIDLNEIINHVLEFTKVKWKDEAELKGITYHIHKEFSPLPSIEGCAPELREVLVNLINNALDAMPKGGEITIKTLAQNSSITFIMQDSGIGIPKAIRTRIFDPFFTTKGKRSSGLGLSVSYGIIKRHRGDMTVESKEGQGTTFTIKIPVSKKSNPTVKEEEQTDLTQSKNAHILIIEDEEAVRTILYDILTAHGHHVSAASHGKEGLQLFQEGEFDMVFTDLGMPGISGWQVAQGVKNINPQVPVAIITGWQIQMSESQVRARGVDTIINKPFKIEQILHLAQEWAGSKDNP
jgi:PAS domain S-box-containing protein